MTMANFALIDYKDITESGEKTKLIKNGTSNWFHDIDKYKEEINKIYVDGGGDDDETVVDALAMASQLDFRQNADKFVVLVTDAGYKVDNNYNISSMPEMLHLLSPPVNNNLLIRICIRKQVDFMQIYMKISVTY